MSSKIHTIKKGTLIKINRVFSVRERYIPGRKGWKAAKYQQEITGICFWWKETESRGGMIIQPHNFTCDCIQYNNNGYCNHYPHDNKIWFTKEQII